MYGIVAIIPDAIKFKTNFLLLITTEIKYL